MTLNRREFVELAAAFGAASAWGGAAAASRTGWTERRDLFPQGVASGDPAPDGIMLWTRRPFDTGERHILKVEVAEDEGFQRVVARAPAPAAAAADWTCRVLVGGLKPRHVYWYRFTDEGGNGSRIGRTMTAPAPDDARPVSFAFVSCQNPNLGAMNAYRRMIWEDERAQPDDRLGFVLHLGDFIYELVWYPEDRPQGMYDRKIRDIGRIPGGEKVTDFHIPMDVDGYRAVYRAYLHDADLQDARARWPFVAIWDNHEFSWNGWQSVQQPGAQARPGQKVKVAANQAWFEYQPARVHRPGKPSLERFDPPHVENVPLDRFDADGLSREPNNLAAIGSLTGYRALRYGRHLDLIVTDQRSYRSPDPFAHPELDPLNIRGYVGMVPEEALQILDAGRTYAGGHPPDVIKVGATSVPNTNRNAPPQTILGATQKAWFKDRLRRSQATWKIWGNTLGTPDLRADAQNLPPGLAKQPWPGAGFANLGGGDFGTAYVERGEIFDLVREAGITGFAIVSGDRHAFWAGYAAKALPPGRFEPVGLSFVGGSVTSVGTLEAYEHNFPKDHPLRPLFLIDRPGAATPEHAYNMLLLHGVRACLDYAAHGDLAKARALSNPDVAPHVTFVDAGSHGYAIVRLSADEMRTEFVCIPRPIAPVDRPDGGPLRYRVVHAAKLWRRGERPIMRQQVLEGDPGLSI